jgi:hypothetical protein
VLVWALAAAALSLATSATLVATGGLAVRRYSGTHLVGHLVVAGRGLYFSRTADGTWWQLRLRPCGRICEDRGSWGDPPPDIGVREPRRPPGPGPLADGAHVDPPLS